MHQPLPVKRARRTIAPRRAYLAHRAPNPTPVPRKNGCPILAVILSDRSPQRRTRGAEGPAPWNSGEGWDARTLQSALSSRARSPQRPSREICSCLSPCMSARVNRPALSPHAGALFLRIARRTTPSPPHGGGVRLQPHEFPPAHFREKNTRRSRAQTPPEPDRLPRQFFRNHAKGPLPTSRHERSRCGGGRMRVLLNRHLWLPG
jgi:hypothetical protein